METLYKCKTCGWQGPESELDYDTTETCSGPEKLEVCPKCGSMEVNVVRE